MLRRIRRRLGSVPPFFASAVDTPAVLAELWRQTETAYLDNPLPGLFKEKVGVLLSRYGSVPYCLFCHVASMRPLGLDGDDIVGLLSDAELDLSRISEACRAPHLRDGPWSEHGTQDEMSALKLAVGLFLSIDRETCLARLRALIGPGNVAALLLFINYKRLCFDWALSHPTLDVEADARVREHFPALRVSHPALASTLIASAVGQREKAAAW
ncbi:MAG TPA: hypothetical protein VFH51_02090, partial [Myxococcota bacterium]|nr:hypothetical protein [Myxococcota bacterium]